MRARVRRVVEVAAPARQVWDYVTDWPAQGEWVPFTRVERVDAADRVGGRLRAWTGLGPVGFWDPMTITRWERDGDGGGICEVLHTGSVVRGEGEFSVVSLGPGRCRFVWVELVVVPGGGLARLLWSLARPVVERMIDRALDAMRRSVEARGGPSHGG